MLQKLKKRYIGDREFYRMVLVIALPIMIQNGITNFVGLLDNIMVGQLGTEQMSGVAIVNQLLNVYYVCLFGCVSGASIFSAQYYGQGNIEGFRNTFRFKWISCGIMAILWLLLLGISGGNLIQKFLNDTSSGSVAQTYQAGQNYLFVMMLGMIPYMVMQIYASSLRETGQTLLPMIGSIVAVILNLCINYSLIFGHFGFPKLGVVGAAVGTVISRFVEMLIVVIWSHSHKDELKFIKGVYRTLRIPKTLIQEIFRKGTPLIMNEILWSAGQAVLVQGYSLRGLNAVASLNIATTVSGLFNVVFIALGSAVSIIVGQQLGAGELDRAVETDRKLIFFSVISCMVVGAVLYMIAPLFPEIYKTSDEVRMLAAELLKITALFLPVYAFYNTAYFTLRSGGKTMITFLFDSCYVWAVNIPVVFCFSRFTSFGILTIYLACQMAELFKVFMGYLLLKKKVWVQNMVLDMK